MKNLGKNLNIMLIFSFLLNIGCDNYNQISSCSNLYQYEMDDGSLTGRSYNYNDCINPTIKRKYFERCKCRKSCYQYYKRYDEINYVVCYPSLYTVLYYDEVKFFDTYQKKCWKNFPSDEPYYIKTKYANNKFEVVQWCPNYYSKGTSLYNSDYTNYNWCVDNCKTQGLSTTYF